MPYIPIHTDRLVLRQWQESDHEPYITMGIDAEGMRYFPALQTRQQTLAQIEGFKSFIDENGYGLFAVERIDTGEFIGFTGLVDVHFDSFFTPCIEIAWRLARAHWGQGFAQEAARACLDLGFKEIGLYEIYSFTSILNLSSINVMKKIGMKEIGKFDHPKIADADRLKTHVLYRIDENDPIRI